MSILGNIFNKIFHRKPKAAPQPTPAPQAQTPKPQAAPAPQAQPAPAPAPEPVDVEAVLEELAAESPQQLNWRTSIVDLMKLVGMESSLAERKELADELGYTGDKSDSASMNIWLHKQVLKKLADNGGKVPAELLD